MKPISPTRFKIYRLYLKTKRAYFKAHPCCERCRSGARLTLHHKRGRAGSLLCDSRFFATLCMVCHNFVHNNPRQARKEGWLCAPGLWNKVPR